DGTPYHEDPAIFAWELANEPRTSNGGPLDRPHLAPEGVITAWADEMSTYMKSIDRNHMLAVGDEGFLARDRSDWPYRAAHGVDSEQLISLPHIDFGTFHLYPDHWNKSIAWGNEWITLHLEVSRRLRKPVVLEEYGIQVEREQ